MELPLESDASRQSHYPRLRRWTELNAQPGSAKSLFLGRRIQHFNRRLRRCSERAVSKSNRMVAAICESLHCAVSQIRRASSARCCARLHALHWLFGWRTHERLGCELPESE